MTTRLMSLESSMIRRNNGKLNTWSKKGKMLMVNFYLEQINGNITIDMSINDAIVPISLAQYNVICDALRSAGFISGVN